MYGRLEERKISWDAQTDFWASFSSHKATAADGKKKEEIFVRRRFPH